MAPQIILILQMSLLCQPAAALVLYDVIVTSETENQLSVKQGDVVEGEPMLELGSYGIW